MKKWKALIASVALFLILFSGSCRTEMEISTVSIETKYHTSSGQTEETKPLDASFFENCAFVSVDIQEGTKPDTATYEMPKSWVERGFSRQDVIDAVDNEFDVARPNAAKVAQACREIDLKMIFIHWGNQFKDGVDLDPDVYREFSKAYGTDYEKWGMHISSPSARPAKFYNVRPGEYVISKTAQDAFPSSNIEYVLRNLGIENIVFVGGHTGACLGKTAASARLAGFKTLCVKDATYDARDSTWLPNIEAVGYDYYVTTDEFLKLTESAAGK